MHQATRVRFRGGDPLALTKRIQARRPGPEHLRPRCQHIDPDADEKGYYCRFCGYELIETSTGWYRHGTEWRHPEVWR